MSKSKNGKKRSTIEKLFRFLCVVLALIFLTLMWLIFDHELRWQLAAFLGIAAFFISIVVLCIIAVLLEREQSQKLERTGRLLHKKQSEHENVPSQAPPHYTLGDDGEIIEAKEKAKRS